MDTDFRSLLFVPADSPTRLAQAAQSGADVVVLDLEDMVAFEHKAAARAAALAFLRDSQTRDEAPALFVRVNGFSSGFLEQDLASIMPCLPRAIILPKAQSGADVRRLAHLLTELETTYDSAEGTTGIVPLVTDRAASLFGLATYASCSSRLLALAWGAEDLASDMGADDPREDNGDWSAPFALARNLTLFAAAAAGIPAIDTVFRDFGDRTGLRHEAMRAESDGFGAKMALHPDQIAIINHVFTPHGEALDRAHVIIAAFEVQPQATHISIEGHVFDRAQWMRAKRLVARAQRA